MGKEERDKLRKVKDQADMQAENQRRMDKLKAYDQVIKLLRAKKLYEDKVIIGNQRFSIFNGSEYAEIVERHYDEFLKLIGSYYTTPNRQKNEITEATKRVDLTNFLLSQLVIIRVEPNEKASKLRNAHDKFIPTKEQSISNDSQITDGLFLFNPHINIQSKSNYVYMVLILLGIALVILFPVWPMILKRGLFYLSVLMLFLLVGLIVVRTFFYFLVRVFGYDFYIFPNLFADVPFLESFKPIVGWEKCDDSKLVILARFVGIFVMGYLVYFLSVERHAVKDFGQQTFDDVIDWGYKKLEGQQAPPPRSIDQIINDFDKETEEQIEEQLKEQNKEM